MIDASGKYVLPGAVDVHTHMDLQAGAHRAVDDFYTGTVAAACGTTTIVDHMAFGPKGCSPVAPGGGSTTVWPTERRSSTTASTACSSMWMNGCSGRWGELADREGITSFKAYLTYDDRLDDGALFQVLRQAKEDGIVIPAHCENDGVVSYLRGLVQGPGPHPAHLPRQEPPRPL